MGASDLIDHSPHHPSPSPPIATASNLVLIDNYDSFTWNVYQYLILEGATVTVYRNDEVTLDEIIAKNPTQLVVSPGPGHPATDAGVSNDAIKHFAGRIPILGVCLGEQCIFHVFGGNVDVTGEILHGKTSPLLHDAKGIYSGLSQDLPATRYHSLAGTHGTLPECLEVSSWILAKDGAEKGVIMGVRHKEFVIEGVQFHPESILSNGGRVMIQNFLHMQGGTWAEHERLKGSRQPRPSSTQNDNTASLDTSRTLAEGTASEKKSILERIYDHRRAAVEAQKIIPSLRPIDLQAAYDMDLSPPLISFPGRLKQSPYRLSLMAEIKRASPSKGIISSTACAPAQARAYAQAGASVISVLTEPEWFKGSIEDLRAVRRSLEAMPNRPAVLRKEFIFDEYQILEARLAGADTVLLIVKMLDNDTLSRLFHYSRSLGMEPLVEVNTAEEMETAISMGSKVIGVNNRNLKTFEVDLETTSRLMANVPTDTIICALSGIAGPKDVESYETAGVGAVLVGEALMRASNVTQFVSDLLGRTNAAQTLTKPKLAVKICGTRSSEAAKAAVEAGADLIGIILASGRKRTVTTEAAVSISETVHTTPKPGAPNSDQPLSDSSDYFEYSATSKLLNPRRALLVGVFQNQPLDYVLSQVQQLRLDVVQFHGSEPLEWSKLVPVPVIRSFKPNEPGLASRGYHALPLLDSGAGGTGQQLDFSQVRETLSKDSTLHVILAGGLNPENVQAAIEALGDLKHQIRAVDVSSGVEEGDAQSIDKIRAFIASSKAIVF